MAARRAWRFDDESVDRTRTLLTIVAVWVASWGSLMGAERVPAAGIVNGVPQGMFVGRES